MSLLRRIAQARLEGVKVTLRPVEPSDAERAYELLHGRQEILRWLLWQGPSSIPELERSFAPWGAQGSSFPDYLFAIVESEGGRFWGTIGLRFGGRAGGADIGYWLGEAVWGRGFGSEAIHLCCAFAFQFLRAPSLSAWAFVGNEASKTALERSGFGLMRTVLQKTERDGKAYDQWQFVLIREDWMAANTDLRPGFAQIEYSD